MHNWMRWGAGGVLAFLSSVFNAGAQGSNLPPPTAGTYSCYAIDIVAALQYQYRPNSPGSNYSGFQLVPTGQPQVQVSALGKFTLDGKGKYTHVDMTGKPMGAGKGTYTFDKTTGKVKFAGSLADNKYYKLLSYKVHRTGEFTFAFNVGGFEHTCVTFVKGDPLPTLKTPNAALTGVITVGTPTKGYDISLKTGTVTWSGEGMSLQRLTGGLMAYALFGKAETSDSNSGQLVIAQDQGQVLTRISKVIWDDHRTPPLVMNRDGTRILVGEGRNWRPNPNSMSGTDSISPRWKLLNAKGEVLGYTPEAYNFVYPPIHLPAFLPDGRILMPDSQDKSLYVYDANLKTRTLFVQEPSSMPVVSPDGKVVAMLRGNQIVFTTAGGVELRRVNVEQGVTVNAMTFSPDGKYLALGVNNGGYRVDILAFMPITGNDMNPLLDNKGEPLKVSGLGYRLSWWTGQSALPPAWKNGVPSGTNTNTTSQTTQTQPRQTTTPQTTTQPQTSTPANSALWPIWLPKANVQLGYKYQGQLNLTKSVNDSGNQGLQGTLRAGSQNIQAAYLVNSTTKGLLIDQGGGDILLCIITNQTAKELSGELYLSQDGAEPDPVGENCRLWTP